LEHDADAADKLPALSGNDTHAKPVVPTESGMRGRHAIVGGFGSCLTSIWVSSGTAMTVERSSRICQTAMMMPMASAHEAAVSVKMFMSLIGLLLVLRSHFAYLRPAPSTPGVQP
jgi:hypothetical protein